MKKKLLIILIGILLLSPNYIKANHTSPSTIMYKAVITKKDGFKCNNKTIIPYGTIVTISEYYRINDEPSLSIEEYETTEEEQEHCNNDINYSDFELYTKDFNIMDYNEDSGIRSFSSIKEVLILSKKGVKLYKGPSFSYDVIETIPSGTKLNTKYYVECWEGKSWVYVSYNGKTGWIYLLTYDVAYGPEKEENIVVSSFMDELEGNTLINEYYYTGGSIEYQGMMYYVKYKDKMYFVSHLASKFEKTITLKNNTKFYEYGDSIDAKGTIPKGTEIKTLYSYGYEEDFWYYVLYNEKKVWILLSEEEFDEYFYAEDENENENENDYYKDSISIENINFLSNEIKLNERLNINIKINNNSNTNVEKILLIFKNKKDENKLIYLNDIDTKPYINIDSNLFENGELNLKYVRLEMNDESKTRLLYSVNDIKNKNNYKLNIINEKNSNVEDNNNTEETKKKIEEIHKINNKHLYIGIGSAISITITSIILIILINKRRKAK